MACGDRNLLSCVTLMGTRPQPQPHPEYHGAASLSSAEAPEQMIELLSRTIRTIAVALVVLVGVDAHAQLRKVTELRNIDYIPQAEYRNGKDRLDLYIPAGATNAPVILSLHGGVLMAGDRREESFVGERFAAAGYLTVIPSYRLSP